MTENLATNLGNFLKKNPLSIGLVLMGVIFIVISILLLSTSQPETHISTTPVVTGVAKKIVPIPTKSTNIVIDIEGAVNKPGVYSLPAQSRVQDAVATANGFSSDADQQKISQSLNLASKLTDSMKIYIPKIGDTQAVDVLGASVQSDQSGQGATININTASAAELDKLPGIGQVTAQKIIDNRPYASIEDLQSKKIVKSNVYSEIKDKIVAE